MSFEVPADAYRRFMGRFSEPLATHFVELLGVSSGDRVLDVGSGPGALTTELVRRLGPATVAAVDPSPPFVESLRAQLPDVDVRLAAAEDLPFADNEFDCAAAQLVVHFMADPVAGLAEMARVTRLGGLVSACVWDHGGGGGPLSTFWRAVRMLDPDAPDESGGAGAREGHLADLEERAGLTDVRSTRLTVPVRFAGFEQWWDPFTLGVGPAGQYVARLDDAGRSALAAQCATLLGPPPFEISASAWAASGRV